MQGRALGLAVLQTTFSRQLRSVQFEFGIRRVAVAQVAPVVEKKLSKSSSLDPLEKLLRDDLVRVHIDAIQRGDDSGVSGERFHKQDLGFGIQDLEKWISGN